MDARHLAQLAQDCVMSDHHLGNLQRVAQPDRHMYPAPYEDTMRPLLEHAMVHQVRRSARLANQFLDALDLKQIEDRAYHFIPV